MRRSVRGPMILSALLALFFGGSVPVAVADPSSPPLPALPSVSSPPSIGSAGASSSLWWGSLHIARGGTDLVTVMISPRLGTGPIIVPQWAVSGTWMRVGGGQLNRVSGTIGSDGRATLVFWVPGEPAVNRQVSVGVAGVGFDGRLYGTVTVVQGPDLYDTFSFVLNHQ